MRRFSLVELLVVVAIFAILVSLLTPSLRQAMRASRQAVCMNQLKQIAAASAVYGEDYNTYLPKPKVFGSGTVSFMQVDGDGRYGTLGAGYRTWPWDTEPQASFNPYGYTNNKRMIGPQLGLAPYLGDKSTWICPDSEAARNEETHEEAKQLTADDWELLTEQYLENERPSLHHNKRRQLLGYYMLPAYDLTKTSGRYEFRKGGSWNYKNAYPGPETTTDAPERVIAVDMTLAWPGNFRTGKRNRSYFYDVPHSVLGYGEGTTNIVSLDGSVGIHEVFTGMEPWLRDTGFSEQSQIDGLYTNFLEPSDREDQSSLPVQPGSFGVDGRSTVIPLFFGNIVELNYY